jgi:hypothetical protein
MHLVSDFDGVWTDPRAEADAIRALMIERLAQAAELGRERVAAAFAAIEEEFARHPFEHGWQFEGSITAYAGEDMYGRNHAIATCLWAGQLSLPDGERLRAAIAQAAGNAEKLADSCFGDARRQYRQQHKTFLDAAANSVIEQLRARNIKITIVSNSRIAHILDLFEAAEIDMTGIDVVGGAKKFHLGALDRVPEYWSWNGGKISLRRPHYFELLEQLRPDAVIGDVLSLDLALPLYLRGAHPDWRHFRAGLIMQPYTPAWVMADKETAGRQGLDFLSGLADLPGWLERLEERRKAEGGGRQ